METLGRRIAALRREHELKQDELAAILANAGKEYDLLERIVVSTVCGKQTVDHIHFHVLGQRDLKWPPG